MYLVGLHIYLQGVTAPNTRNCLILHTARKTAQTWFTTCFRSTWMQIRCAVYEYKKWYTKLFGISHQSRTAVPPRVEGNFSSMYVRRVSLHYRFVLVSGHSLRGHWWYGTVSRRWVNCSDRLTSSVQYSTRKPLLLMTNFNITDSFLTLYAPCIILQYVYEPTRCTKFLWSDFIFIRCSTSCGLY